MPAKRAPRITAPGAERIVLTGIMAASDDFGRVRMMVLDEGQDGRPNPSAQRLRGCARESASPDPLQPTASVPYELRDETPLPPSAEGVRGTCWFALPARYKKHWLDTAAELRGRWVRAEVLVRRFAFEQADARRAGVSLDLSMLAPLEAAPPR